MNHAACIIYKHTALICYLHSFLVVDWLQVRDDGNTCSFVFRNKMTINRNVEEGVEIPAGIIVLLFGRGEYQSKVGVHLTGGAKKR